MINSQSSRIRSFFFFFTSITVCLSLETWSYFDLWFSLSLVTRLAYSIQLGRGERGGEGEGREEHALSLQPSRYRKPLVWYKKVQKPWVWPYMCFGCTQVLCHWETCISSYCARLWWVSLLVHGFCLSGWWWWWWPVGIAFSPICLGSVNSYTNQ